MAWEIDEKQIGTAPSESKAVQHARFFREFVRKPGTTGAIAPSSPGLCRLMTKEAALEGASVIVEYGPGTGPVTEELIAAKPVDSKLISIERNEEFVVGLRERFPDLDIAHSCVQDLPDVLAARGETQADRIVSGLPWASFEPELQRDIMQVTHDTLAPDGIFVTFAYVQGLALPRAWRYRSLLNKLFSDVKQTEVVWANMPPAFVYRCRK